MTALSESQNQSQNQHHHEFSADTIQFLTFTVGEGEYGVDIMTVREIKGWSETTRLPNMPGYMRGVINLRGIVVPIFDLRTRFGMGVTEANPKNVVIILAIGERTVGVLVDAVSDILTIESNQIKPPPTTETHVEEVFINGLISVDERMVVLLDVNHLFDKASLNEAADAAA